MLQYLLKRLRKNRIRKNAFLISSSSIKSKSSEVFVLRQGLLYVLDDKIVHLTFDGDGVELGLSNLEKGFTVIAHAIIIGSFLFVPIYAFVQGAWYLGLPYSLFAIPASILLIRRLRVSATPMILKREVKQVQIKYSLFQPFIPFLEVKTCEKETFRIALGNSFYLNKKEKIRLKQTLLEKGYLTN
jgi:hypothetical protein